MNKIFNIVTSFKAQEDNEGLLIKGMASTSDIDRSGDVIAREAWEKGGLNNFKGNPVILFNHNSNEPIGKAESIEVTSKGLALSARISKAAGKTYELIKDGVLGAFSVSFLIKDADYIEETYGLLIKDAELLEVSVVSIPCNQAATFSLAKSFESTKEYEDFKKTFTHSVDLAGQSLANKEDKSSTLASHTPAGALNAQMEIDMTPEELKALTEKVAKDAAESAAAAVKIQLDMANAKAKAEKQAADEAADRAATITAKDGAERLVVDLQTQLAAKDVDMAKTLDQFKADLDEKAAELEKMRVSRGQFNDRGNGKSIEEIITLNSDEIFYAGMLGAMTNKGWSTDYATRLLEKAGIEYTTNAGRLDEELQNRLQKEITVHTKVAQLFREIPVNGQSTVMPVQSDTNMASWSGAAVTAGNLENNPQVTSATYEANQVIMLVYRLISSSYLDNDTDEAILINLMPMLVDGVSRAHARAVESAILIDTGTFDGLDTHATVATGTIAAGGMTAAKLLSTRKQMGKYGLSPDELVYIVNQDSYFALLGDAEFANINEVGGLATKIKGSVGSVYGTPVVVSDEYNTVGTTKSASHTVHTGSYVIPRLRGVKVEQDYEVMNQRRVIVATQNLGFTELFAAAPASVRVNYT